MVNGKNKIKIHDTKAEQSFDCNWADWLLKERKSETLNSTELIVDGLEKKHLLRTPTHTQFSVMVKLL